MKTSEGGRIEILESRVAPAGIVTVAYDAALGSLTLTGDVEANSITVLAIGPGEHRIQANDTTTLAGGLTFQDIAKLTSITFTGGAGADSFTIGSGVALKKLTFDGGLGNDSFLGTDLNVKGEATFTGGDGADELEFEGTLTNITGNLRATDNAGSLEADFQSADTIIGGSILWQGNGSVSELIANHAGIFAVRKGIDFDVSAGSAIDLTGRANIFIGKLPSGQSIRGDSSLIIEGGNITMAGPIETLGGTGNSMTVSGTGVVKLGKSAQGVSIQLLQADDLTIEAGQLTMGAIEFDTAQTGLHTLTINVPGGKAVIGRSIEHGASIDFQGSEGDDRIRITAANAVLAGGIDFQALAGANTLSLLTKTGSVKIGKLGERQLGSSLLGASIIFTGGDGADQLTSEVGRLAVAGGIVFRPGDGDNEFLLDAVLGTATIGRTSRGDSISYDPNAAGAGNDRLDLTQASLTLAGRIFFRGGSGGFDEFISDNEGVLRVGMAAFPRNSIDFSGENFSLGGLRVQLQGGLQVLGFAGNEEVSLDGNITIGKNSQGHSVLFSSGDGNDELRFSDTIVLAGGVVFEQFQPDTGNDFLSLSDHVTINGPVRFVGGGGDDQVIVNSYALRLGSSFTFEGGTGTDSAQINANGLINGDVSIALGDAATGNQSLAIRSQETGRPSLALNGNLQITSAGIAGTTDTLVLTNLRVAKAITATLGAGASTIVIDNLIADSTVNLDAGDGNDVINIERNNFAKNSIIAGLTTILTGLGNDTLRIGSLLPPPNGGLLDSTRVRFLGGLTIDGGSGTDSRNAIDTENDFPGGTLTGLGTFETIVP